MKKCRFFIVITIVLLCGWFLVAYDIIPPVVWGFKTFAKPDYFHQLKSEWQTKPSNFLLRKLYSVDVMRFAIAAGILAERNEHRAIPILVHKAQSNYIDDGIHFSACGVLAIMSPDTASKVLMNVVNKYKNVKNRNLAYREKYENALKVLASMKDERVYPICLQMAKSGKRLEEESSLNGMLCYFDNHWEEILPFYLKYLNDNSRHDIAAIDGIKHMKRPEAIPALEEFALKNPMYKREVIEAINYITEEKNENK
jgi:hypothetical protein